MTGNFIIDLNRPSPGFYFKSFLTVDRGHLKKVAHAVGAISLNYLLSPTNTPEIWSLFARKIKK